MVAVRLPDVWAPAILVGLTVPGRVRRKISLCLPCALPGGFYVVAPEVARKQRWPIDGRRRLNRDDSAGRRSKATSISSSILSSGPRPVPKVYTMIEIGLDTPKVGEVSQAVGQARGTIFLRHSARVAQSGLHSLDLYRRKRRHRGGTPPYVSTDLRRNPARPAPPVRKCGGVVK